MEAFAKLTAECKRMGHALHDKVHTGDRWIAACAIAKDIELLAGDGIFQNARASHSATDQGIHV